MGQVNRQSHVRCLRILATSQLGLAMSSFVENKLSGSRGACVPRQAPNPPKLVCLLLSLRRKHPLIVVSRQLVDCPRVRMKLWEILREREKCRQRMA